MSNIAYRIGIFLTTHCSWNTAYRLAEIYARIWYLFDYPRKKIIQRHLQMIFKSESKTYDNSEINKLTFNTFRHFSKYLIEVFRLPLIDKEYIEQNITLPDKTDFDKCLKESNGLILLTAHMGNWELVGVVISHMGYPVTSIARAHTDPQINQLFLSRREQHGLKIIDLDQYAARECIRTLKEGKILGLIGDESFTEHSIDIDFLGEKMNIPRGPAALSRTTGAPVITGVMVRQPDNKFIIHQSEIIYPIHTNNQEEDIRNLTHQYMESLKPYFLKYPEQWYRFR